MAKRVAANDKGNGGGNDRADRFRENLQGLVRQTGLPQRVVADQMGVSLNWLRKCLYDGCVESNWVNEDKLQRVCDYFGITGLERLWSKNLRATYRTVEEVDNEDLAIATESLRQLFELDKKRFERVAKNIESAIGKALNQHADHRENWERSHSGVRPGVRGEGEGRTVATPEGMGLGGTSRPNVREATFKEQFQRHLKHYDGSCGTGLVDAWPPFDRGETIAKRVACRHVLDQLILQRTDPTDRDFEMDAAFFMPTTERIHQDAPDVLSAHPICQGDGEARRTYLAQVEPRLNRLWENLGSFGVERAAADLERCHWLFHYRNRYPGDDPERTAEKFVHLYVIYRIGETRTWPGRCDWLDRHIAELEAQRLLENSDRQPSPASEPPLESTFDWQEAGSVWEKLLCEEQVAEHDRWDRNSRLRDLAKAGNYFVEQLSRAWAANIPYPSAQDYYRRHLDTGDLSDEKELNRLGLRIALDMAYSTGIARTEDEEFFELLKHHSPESCRHPLFQT